MHESGRKLRPRIDRRRGSAYGSILFRPSTLSKSVS